MELMVVVVVISIISLLAIPTLVMNGRDRHAYQDAGAIMQLFREARTRAVARGGAELIAMSSNGAADRGTFVLWEAVAPNPGGGGLNRTPVSSCKAPTVWPPLGAGNPNLVLIDGVNLNVSELEVEADIETQMLFFNNPTDPSPTAFTTGFLCYTPLGHSYLNLGTGAVPLFDGQLPTISPLIMRVTRQAGANQRDVVVPPNGMARLFSHT
jgi:type II secretory pathway pseudopilin PulG